MINRRSFVLWGLTILTLGGCRPLPPAAVPVQPFDAERYLGEWHEIARFDHRFERGLTHVTARYTRRSDGTIAVLNRGFLAAKGRRKEAKAVAYLAEDKRKGQFRVSFFRPFYAPYAVVAIDPDYRWAIVSSGADYLWFLVRNPADAETRLYPQLVEKARAMGFETERLIRVPHAPPLRQ